MKHVLALSGPDVQVVAFAGFVVKPENALFIYDIRQAIFVRVLRARKWVVKLPDDNFGKSVVRVFDSTPNELRSFHEEGSVALVFFVVK